MIALSPQAKLAYDKLNASGMSDWVGGGDPRAIGAECFNAIAAVIDLQQNMRVLDFGCGIGRMSIPMANFLTKGELVGVDIVPGMIELCQQAISPILPNTSFVLSATENPFYSKYMPKKDRPAHDMQQWSQQQGQNFDLIYAFSVFTHLDPDMSQSTFDLFSRLLKPSGLVYITTFLDREDNPLDRKLRPGEEFRDCQPEPLGWVVYAPTSLATIAHGSGFLVRKVLYGVWRGDALGIVKGNTFQDALLLSRPVQIPADIDPDLYVSVREIRMAVRRIERLTVEHKRKLR